MYTVSTVVVTKHAQEKMIKLGISLEQVKKAIDHGSKTQQTDGLLSCYTYYCVAYKRVGEKIYKIKTVYLR